MRITGGRKKIRIGDLLVEAGAITEEELQEALAYQKEMVVVSVMLLWNLALLARNC